MFQKLPKEVIILIYEMNPEHRKIFDSLKNELICNASKMRLRKIDEIWRNTNLINFDHCLKKFLPDPNTVMKGLYECKCCFRHRLKKPKSIVDANDYHQTQPKSDVPNYFSNECQCDCRSMSRHIYHANGNNPRLYQDFR